MHPAALFPWPKVRYTSVSCGSSSFDTMQLYRPFTGSSGTATQLRAQHGVQPTWGLGQRDVRRNRTGERCMASLAQGSVQEGRHECMCTANTAMPCWHLHELFVLLRGISS